MPKYILPWSIFDVAALLKCFTMYCVAHTCVLTIPMVGGEEAARSQAHCNISDTRCREIFTVLLRGTDIHNSRPGIPSRDIVHEGSRDGLLRCFTHHCYADSSDWTSWYVSPCLNFHLTLWQLPKLNSEQFLWHKILLDICAEVLQWCDGEIIS